MRSLVDILLLLVLVLIAIQDFRTRLLSWYLLPIGFLLAAAHRLLLVSFHSLLFDFSVNITLLALQLAGLFIYASIKNRRFTNIIDSWLGLGDILFFPLIAALFPPVLFIFFFTASLFISAVSVTVFTKIAQRSVVAIPLAGMLSLAVMLFLIAGLFYSPVLNCSDSTIAMFFLR